MLEVRPEFHRDRAELNFDLDISFAGGQMDRHPQKKMQAAVAVLLREHDVVFFAVHDDAALGHQSVRDPVDIVDKGADDTDPGDIVQILLDRLKGYGQIVAFQLLVDAVRLFQTGLNIVDRVLFAVKRKVLIQNVQFGLNFQQRTAVSVHQLLRFTEFLPQPLIFRIIAQLIMCITIVRHYYCLLSSHFYYSAFTEEGGLFRTNFTVCLFSSPNTHFLHDII